MQYSLPTLPPTRLAEIHLLLVEHYGPAPAWLRPPPLSQLVLALLGTRTQTAVSKRVFEAVIERFGSWDSVRDAAPDDLAPILAPLTFAERKAVHLPAALRQIHARRGSLDLDFLKDWPVDDALAWLEKLPGVGPKVSAAVLNFSRLQMRALVVDTHHLRVARRLGIVPPDTLIPAAARVLTRQLPDAWTAAEFDTHHTLMKHHGQRRCRSHAPVCRGCPLQHLCPMASRKVSVATVGDGLPIGLRAGIARTGQSRPELHHEGREDGNPGDSGQSKKEQVEGVRHLRRDDASNSADRNRPIGNRGRPAGDKGAPGMAEGGARHHRQDHRSDRPDGDRVNPNNPRQ